MGNHIDGIFLTNFIGRVRGYLKCRGPKGEGIGTPACGKFERKLARVE